MSRPGSRGLGPDRRAAAVGACVLAVANYRRAGGADAAASRPFPRSPQAPPNNSRKAASTRSAPRPRHGAHLRASDRPAGASFGGFGTSANTDLFVWLSENRRPRTTNQVLARPRPDRPAQVHHRGSELPNPPDWTASMRSVIIWCARCGSRTPLPLWPAKPKPQPRSSLLLLLLFLLLP